jgi:hypothetical protein
MDFDPLINLDAKNHRLVTRLKAITVAVIAISGAALSVMIQHQSHTKLRAGEVLLQEHGSQLAALTGGHERLSNLVVRAGSAVAADHAAELAELRHEVGALENQTNDLGRPLAQSRAPQPPRPAGGPEPHSPEFFKQLRQMAGGKTEDAHGLAGAFGLYASDHQNQSPSSLDQLTAYFAKQHLSVSGTNQFEIVYQGSFDRLLGVPLGTVAVIRDPEQWPGPDGRMRRVYGMADGSGQIVESDDNFQAWEARHVIPPP